MRCRHVHVGCCAGASGHGCAQGQASTTAGEQAQAEGQASCVYRLCQVWASWGRVGHGWGVGAGAPAVGLPEWCPWQWCATPALLTLSYYVGPGVPVCAGAGGGLASSLTARVCMH